MKGYLRGGLMVLVAVATGLLGILLDSTSVGRLVESESERSAIIGSACFGQEKDLIKICSGGENSKCDGCGCTDEHKKNDEDQGYAAPDANCNNDPKCQYPFRRGSCKGE